MFPRGLFYMNNETGELLNRPEMLRQAREEYDLNDDTNICDIWEYYTLTNIPADH